MDLSPHILMFAFRSLLRLVAVVGCSCACASAYSLELVGDSYDLRGEFEYLLDPGGRLTLPQIRAHPERYPFMPASSAKPDHGFDPVWLKLQLRFPGGAGSSSYVLSSMRENLYDIRLYVSDGGENYYEWVTGNDYPATSRDIDAPRYSFEITPIDGPMTLYLRVVGGPGTNSFPWVLTVEECRAARSPGRSPAG